MRSASSRCPCRRRSSPRVTVLGRLGRRLGNEDGGSRLRSREHGAGSLGEEDRLPGRPPPPERAGPARRPRRTAPVRAGSGAGGAAAAAGAGRLDEEPALGGERREMPVAAHRREQIGEHVPSAAPVSAKAGTGRSKMSSPGRPAGPRPQGPRRRSRRRRGLQLEDVLKPPARPGGMPKIEQVAARAPAGRRGRRQVGNGAASLWGGSGRWASGGSPWNGSSGAALRFRDRCRSGDCTGRAAREPLGSPVRDRPAPQLLATIWVASCLTTRSSTPRGSLRARRAPGAAPLGHQRSEIPGCSFRAPSPGPAGLLDPSWWRYSSAAGGRFGSWVGFPAVRTLDRRRETRRHSCGVAWSAGVYAGARMRFFRLIAKWPHYSNMRRPAG